MSLSISLNSKSIEFLPPQCDQLCQTIESMLSTKSTQNTSTLGWSYRSPFYLPATKPISLHSYISRIRYYSKISKQTLIMATQYLCEDNPKGCQPFEINKKTIHKLFATAVLIAMKVQEDEHLLNRDYAPIVGMHLHEINYLEIIFLKQRNFQVSIPPEDYSRFEKTLTSQTGSNILPSH